MKTKTLLLVALCAALALGSLGCQKRIQRSIPTAPIGISVPKLDAEFKKEEPKAETVEQSTLDYDEIQRIYDSHVRELRNEMLSSPSDYEKALKDAIFAEIKKRGMAVDLDYDGYPSYASTIENIEKVRQQIVQKWQDELNNSFTDEVFERKLLDLAQQGARLSDKMDFSQYRNSGFTIDWTKWKETPAQSKESIADNLLATIEESVGRQFNLDAKMAEKTSELEEKYKLYKLREHVTITVSRGGQHTETYSGILRTVSDSRVMVGTRYVIRKDISKEDAARIFKDSHEELVQKKLKLARAEFMKQIEKMVETRLDKELGEALINGGYIPIGQVGQGSRIEQFIQNWYPKSEFVQSVRQFLFQQELSKYTDQQLINVMREQGYVFVDGDNDGNREWTTRAAVKFQEEMSKKVEETRVIAEDAFKKSDTGWVVVKDTNTEIGYALLTAPDAKEREQRAMTAYMANKGYMPETYVQDESFWESKLEEYSKNWLHKEYSAAKPTIDDTSFLDYTSTD